MNKRGTIVEWYSQVKRNYVRASCHHMVCPVITWSVLSSLGGSCQNMECPVITWSVLSSLGVSCHHMECPVITPGPWFPSLSVHIATVCMLCRLDDPGFHFRQAQIFLSSSRRPDQLTAAGGMQSDTLTFVSVAEAAAMQLYTNNTIRCQLYITLRRLLSCSLTWIPTFPRNLLPPYLPLCEPKTSYSFVEFQK
jgi:hypothetical protein